MQKILFTTDLFKLVLKGTKTSTIRKGMRNYTLGPVEFISDPPDKNGRVKITKRFITKIELKHMKDLTEKNAKQEAFSSLEQLIIKLKQIYPDIENDSYITIVNFK